MGFPTGGFNIIIPVFSCDKPFVCSIQIPDQSGKGRPNIVGKARHKLAVGFFCLSDNRKFDFIGHNNLIDFIGKRGYQFICCRQNTPIAISIFYINQSIGFTQYKSRSNSFGGSSKVPFSVVTERFSRSICSPSNSSFCCAVPSC